MASKSSRETILIGDRSFQIVKPIGRGSTCKVYLGLDLLTQKQVAIKVYKLFGPTTRRTVRREMIALQECRGPGLCKTIGYDFECEVFGRKKTVVVHEFYPHGELYDILERGRLDQEFAIPMMKQILRGIRTMHDNGFAHRDIKPENILVDKDFNLVIADFGFAKKSEGLLKTRCGTEGYTAPEIHVKNSFYTRKCDVFSAGVCMFIMLSGFPPFQASRNSDWWFNKLCHDPELFWIAHARTHKFTEMQKEILMLMMQPSPRKRLTISEVLEHPFFSQPSKMKDEVKSEIQSRV